MYRPLLVELPRENKIRALPAERELTLTARYIGKTPHYIRRSYATPSALLKITKFDKDPPIHILPPIDDDIVPTARDPEPNELLEDIMKSYMDMKLQQMMSPEKPEPALSASQILQRSRKTRKHRRHPSNNTTSLALHNQLQQMPPRNLSASALPAAKYTIKPRTNYVSGHLLGAEESNGGHLFAFPPQSLELPPAYIRCICTQNTHLEQLETAVPCVQQNDSIKQLGLLTSPSIRPAAHEYSCQWCSRKAFTWCPKCRSIYCFSCWHLMNHSNAMQSEDLLKSHYNALFRTDKNFIEAPVESAPPASLPRGGAIQRTTSFLPRGAPRQITEDTMEGSISVRSLERRSSSRVFQYEWKELLSDDDESAPSAPEQRVVSGLVANLQAKQLLTGLEPFVDKPLSADGDVDNLQSGATLPLGDLEFMRRTDDPERARRSIQILKGRIVRTYI